VINSSTSITATAPAGKGTVDVTVLAGAHQSTPSPADHFIYESPPEFGRCAAAAKHQLTNFDSNKCVKVASADLGTESEKLAKGTYQWLPGVVKPNFTTAGGAMTMKTVVGKTITCTGTHGSGAIVNTKEVGHLRLIYTGCASSGFACTSPGMATGEIATAPLGGTLGFETLSADPAKDHVALELHPEGGANYSELKCVGLDVFTRGSQLHKVVANSMTLTSKEVFAGANGKQKPDHFVGGVAKQHILEMDFEGLGYEQAAITGSYILTREEKLEVSTIN
jgi:hypothetical protein